MPTEYTYENLITGLLNGTILLASGNIAKLTRYTYYNPYKNDTSYPFPTAYVNITNSNIDVNNCDTNNTSFFCTDFLSTVTDWILLNAAV
jgi:hypothetical protein